LNLRIALGSHLDKPYSKRASASKELPNSSMISIYRPI
jgi:hypothetical protein